MGVFYGIENDFDTPFLIVDGIELL